MKNLYLLAILVVAGACSESPPVQNKTGVYEEALLRTRNIFIADRNIDESNPLHIDFYVQYAGQLVELNFETKKMNDSFYTVHNSDVAAKRVSEISSGELRIEFNGIDITSCALLECNTTKCVGQEDDLAVFSGDVDVNDIYLNLTKMSQSSDPNCNPIDFTQSEKVHRITFKEVGNAKLNVLYGARVTAQVAVFNRTHRPEDILNLVQE